MMHTAAHAITREAGTLGFRIEPVSTRTDGGVTYDRVAVRQLLETVSRHSPKLADASNLVHLLRRALNAAPVSSPGADSISFTDRDLRTVAQNLERLNMALNRASKIRRGIIPGALSMNEATQITLQRLGIFR